MSKMTRGARVLRIGIAPKSVIVKRTKDIATGKVRPGPNDPKTWFTSMESLAKVLSERNMLLIEAIRNSQPNSIAELAETTGRAKSNLSRTLKRMTEFGLVRLEATDGAKRPVVTYDQFEIVGGLGRALEAA